MERNGSGIKNSISATMERDSLWWLFYRKRQKFMESIDVRARKMVEVNVYAVILVDLKNIVF